MSSPTKSKSSISPLFLNEETKPSNIINKQQYDSFLVLDFEATCDDQTRLNPQEIIEFPVLRLNGETFEVEDVFHQYVQPEAHKTLTSFCTELTGIKQSMVENQPSLQETLQKFDEWLDLALRKENKSFIFITCGEWDLMNMLPSQCKAFKIDKPDYFNEWINIKKVEVMQCF